MNLNDPYTSGPDSFIVSDHAFYRTAASLIGSATSEILITTYKMKIKFNKKKSPVNDLVNSLIAMARKGVVVSVLMNSHSENLKDSNEFKSVATYLSCKGLQVFTLKRKRILHLKTIVVDNRAAIFGSHNWTPSSIDHNAELSFFTPDRKIVKDVREIVLYLRDISIRF